jgi:nicotinamide mononucleotide transporter
MWPIQIMEIIAVIFGLLNVFLLTRQNIWAWPCGLLMVSLYAFIFFDARLYSDFILHIIYVILNLYGWYYWLRGGVGDEDVPVTLLSKSSRIIWSGVILSGFIIWGTVMYRFTDADYPFPDAFTTVASLVAQYLLARKKLENWILWIIVDLVAINIYFLKELYFTSGLYLVFLILCIIGWKKWQSDMNQEQVIAKEESQI